MFVLTGTCFGTPAKGLVTGKKISKEWSQAKADRKAMEITVIYCEESDQPYRPNKVFIVVQYTLAIDISVQCMLVYVIFTI